MGGEDAVNGLMQQHPLLISAILAQAARHNGTTDIVSKRTDGSGLHRTTYAELEKRARCLVRVLQSLGIRPGERVATLAPSSYRQLEICYAVSGMGAIYHAVDPRLAPDEIAQEMADAGDCALFADIDSLPLVAGLATRVPSLRTVVVLCELRHMLALPLPAGLALGNYEELLSEAGDDYAWPSFDENTASALCYTPDAGGNLKGVLQTHRSTLLQVYAAILPDAYGLSPMDRVMLTSPTCAAVGWILPYLAPMVGASLILPGGDLDGTNLVRMLQEERVTCAAGPPAVWLDVLQELRRSGVRLQTVRRMYVGRSPTPREIIEALGEHGVEVRCDSDATMSIGLVREAA